jgi:hypothetical protein
MHHSGISSQAPKHMPIPPPFADELCDPASTKQPPAQDSKRMQDHLHTGGFEALGQLPARRQHNRDVPATGVEAGCEGGKLQIRAIQPGRRVQEQDPARNRSRRGA